MLGHNYIGTEHILLGLIHEGEGVAAQALESLGISLDDVRKQVEDIIGRGPGSPAAHIPFTPRGKKILELSLREALQLGNNYIGTEHLLLGVIREGEGVGAQILVKLGAELTKTRTAVIAILSGTAPPVEEKPAWIKAKAKTWAEEQANALVIGDQRWVLRRPQAGDITLLGYRPYRYGRITAINDDDSLEVDILTGTGADEPLEPPVD